LVLAVLEGQAQIKKVLLVLIVFLVLIARLAVGAGAHTKVAGQQRA
jgi:hypothetical protein